MPRKPPVSDLDAQLFRDAVADVRPLPAPAENQTRRSKRPAPRPQKRRDERPTASTPSNEMREVAPVGAEESLDFVRPGLQHSLLRRLRRGQITLEGRLDLHGMTANEAGLALDRFIELSTSNRRRYVLVVHGKGHRSATAYPVLKSQVNGWLRQRPDVLAFYSALPADGGTGAVYILLKTRR